MVAKKVILMAFTPDYTEGDLSASVIDIIVKGILTVGTFVTIIVLIMLYNYVRRRL